MTIRAASAPEWRTMFVVASRIVSPSALPTGGASGGRSLVTSSATPAAASAWRASAISFSTDVAVMS